MRRFAALGPHSPLGLRLLAPLVAVAGAAGLGLLIRADVAVAALLLLLAVVVASLLGLAAGGVAAVGGAVLLNLAFTPPKGTLEVRTGDDVVAIVTFVLVALVEGTLVGRSADLRQAQAEAEQARVEAAMSRLRAGFLSAVSHNLRTPLAAISASASTLNADEAVLDDGERRELLETIRDETARLERLVAKVLDVSRIRAGGMAFEPKGTDFGGLVQAVVHRLRPLLRGHDVRLDVAAVPQAVVDVTMMEQILLNLLENAVRHAPPGTPIEVAAARRDGAVLLRVTDHGPGVPVADRERVFEAFQRGDPRDESAGTGLGLSIVAALTAAHGGQAWVEETPGGGASFVVSVPQR